MATPTESPTTEVSFWVVVHKHRSTEGKWAVAPSTFATRGATFWCIQNLRRDGYLAKPRRVAVEIK